MARRKRRTTRAQKKGERPLKRRIANSAARPRPESVRYGDGGDSPGDSRAPEQLRAGARAGVPVRALSSPLSPARTHVLGLSTRDRHGPRRPSQGHTQIRAALRRQAAHDAGVTVPLKGGSAGMPAPGWSAPCGTSAVLQLIAGVRHSKGASCTPLRLAAFLPKLCMSDSKAS